MYMNENTPSVYVGFPVSNFYSVLFSAPDSPGFKENNKHKVNDGWIDIGITSVCLLASV